MKTYCNYCGTVSNNTRPGDGCHACQKGVMIQIEKRNKAN